MFLARKSNTVEQIKAKLGIVEVVSSYIKLQKAGGAYKALCPFHNEKTPSMSISPDRGSFHCFGCGKGGDIFSFVQEMEGLDFLGALKVLAERAGVEIARGGGERGGGEKKEREEKERLYEILDEAADFFHRTLAKNEKNTEVLRYLKERGLLAKTAQEFYLGFAEDSWDELCKHLLAKKYSGEDMEKAGLVLRAKEGRRGYYDRFRSRLMFPLSDSAGRVVGFSGRIFVKKDGEGKRGEGEMGAKYINSPETLLYEKSKILYGLDKAKQAIREKGYAVLVEGQMDLILSHQMGARNTVAVSGTALTEDHLKTLKRFTEKILLAFDGDSAGLLAAHRAGLLAIGLGMEVSAVKIPAGKDPADSIRENPAVWATALENALPIVTFFLEFLHEREKDTRTFRLAVQKEVLPLVAAIKSRIERAHFVETISKKIGISQEAIEADMQKALSNSPEEEDMPVLPSSVPVPEMPHKKSRSENIRREIEGILLWQEEKEGGKEDMADFFAFRKTYEKILSEAKITNVEGLAETEKRELVFRAEERYGKRNDIGQVMEELLRELELNLLEDRRTGMMEEFSAEPSPEWQKNFSDLSRRIEELKKGR